MFSSAVGAFPPTFQVETKILFNKSRVENLVCWHKKDGKMTGDEISIVIPDGLSCSINRRRLGQEMAETYALNSWFELKTDKKPVKTNILHLYNQIKTHDFTC